MFATFKGGCTPWCAPDAIERILGALDLLDDTLKALRLAILDLSPEEGLAR